MLKDLGGMAKVLHPQGFNSLLRSACGWCRGNIMKNPRLRVLVADDNAAAAEIMATLLSIQGHHATSVFDGKSAIKAAKAIQPHLILLDINLGDMSGYEVCAQLRNEPALKNAMLVAVTGLKRNECEKEGAHFDEYLIKPTGMEMVDTLLERCIHRLNTSVSTV